MAESKFLPFQDADGDLHNDKCKIDDLVFEMKECPTCTPNENSLVPDWKNEKDPYLNERNCKYQIPYKTTETTTGYVRGMTEEEAEEALKEIFEKYQDKAIVDLLEFYNKSNTTGAILLIKDVIEYTDYDLVARPGSRLKLLYSVPHDTLNAIDDAEADEEDENEEDTAGTTITYETNDLEAKLIRVRKGLALYNRYYKVFRATSGENKRFVFTSGNYTGKTFQLEKYGDYGLGINPGNKRAKLELVYTDLVKFLRERNYSLRPSVSFGFKEPVTKIEMTFDEEYTITKLKVFTIKCGIKPEVFTTKLEQLRKLDGWKDKAAVGYFAQLDKMDQDLQARTPRPWAEFVEDYTYPKVELSGASELIGAEEASAGCIAQAIGEAGASLLDVFDGDFTFGDALATKWNQYLCMSDPAEKQGMLADLNLTFNPRQKQILREQGKLPTAKQSVSDFVNAAKAQAYDQLEKEKDPFALLCLAAGDGLDFDLPDILAQLKVCGLEAALTQAITCLFGGLTLEISLSKVLESAFRAMNIQNFNDLFIGLPAEQQAELDALAKKKLQEGDIFRDKSTAQEVSDAIASNQMPTLSQIAEEEKKDPPKKLKEKIKRWFEETEMSSADPNTKTRTLAQKFDNPSDGLDRNRVIDAYIAAILEYYSDNLLEMVDRLNRFPGARLISNAILAVDCPIPPLFNPTIADFIKDLELPFCRNGKDITLPKLQNPFEWIPEKGDILAALFAALKELVLQLITSILVKLFVKICQIISSAVCKALEAAGSIAAGLVTGGGLQNLSSIVREAFCGDNATADQVNDSIVEMFANFGLGAEAFADKEQTLALAESMANTMTQKELADAFLGNMSPEAATIMSEIINSEYPSFSSALPTPESMADMFAGMGNILPLEFRQQLSDLANQIPEDEIVPVNPSLCATEEQLEEFCEARSAILGGRASPEQISALCNNQFDPNDLGDLQSVLEGGLDNYIANNMPPITSDPGCDNGLLPYEPEETVQAVTAGLGNDLELLKVDYSTDMLGNGPLEKNWGLMNMMMSDTEGMPLTAHIRKTQFNPLYVDEYGTFFPDPKVIVAAGLVNPVAAFALNLLNNKNKSGVFPTKVSAFLQYYMNGEIQPYDDFIAIDYNNKVTPEYTKTIDLDYNTYGEVSRPFLADNTYNVSMENVYSSDNGALVGVEVFYGARKSQADIMLSYSDYARGYKQFGESEYEYGFDIEGFLSEASGSTTLLYSDNMRVQITERVNRAAKSYDDKTTAEIEFSGDVDSLNGGDFESLNEEDFAQADNSEQNADLDIDSGVEFNFLSVDDTFADFEEILEGYTEFQNSFGNTSLGQPQDVLMREIIKKQNPFSRAAFSTDQMNVIREDITKNAIQNIYTKIADINSEVSAWSYGRVAETLTQEDLDYGINDNGTFVLYKDTGLTDEDMVLGISRDQYNNEMSGTLSSTRVFYLDPEQFGGSYKKPGIYMKPPEFKGWFGLIDVLFPDYSPCKPQSTDLIDFGSIKEKIDEIYPTIPEDERLKSDPDCIVELPYNRVLERPAKAAMVGLIMAACRIFASAHVIKTLPTFATFTPNFPEVYSTAYASYILENMKKSFKNARGADWELFNGFSDEDFWYGFLEQSVQMYSYRIDNGEIEPPQSVLDALIRLNNLQEDYDYPKSRADVRGSIGILQTLKNYRLEKNLEAVKETEDLAELVLKEWIIEQLNFMAQKLIKNLETIGFEAEVKDIQYYFLENFVAGSKLTINKNIDSYGKVQAQYGDLPTIPWEDNDEAEVITVGGEEIPSYYTYGGEFVIYALPEYERNPGVYEEGQEYVGPYHVHINDIGDVVYMVGEQHSDTQHPILQPLSNVMSVPIGDVAELDSITDPGDKSFVIEKYISINNVKYDTTTAVNNIMSNSDLGALVSEVYPGTMKLVESDGRAVGIEGELGLRYGLKLSIVVEGSKYDFTSVEIDALDLPLKDFKTLSANSVLLYCLVKELKNDPSYQLLTRYIVPLPKFISLAAIYNDMGMLPSIGQIVVPKQELLQTNIDDILASLPGELPEEVNTVLETITTADLELDRINGAWAHPRDRKNRKGVLVLSWDNWGRELLINSTSRIKKLFKTYYNSRDFDVGEIANSTDGPGEIFLKTLKERMKPAPGRQTLPWHLKRRFKDNPFNSLGELCKKEDV